MDEWTLIGHSLGEYQIQEEIGRGGMAVVYKAWQPSLHRHVAIKVLPPQFTFDRTFVQRFRQEAIAAAQLQHPNIVTIYGVHQRDGTHYIAMAYIPGGSLSKLLEQAGALPLERAANIVCQVAEALDYAHSQGLVHRDIKPGNILVGADDHVTLTDFGLVKAISGTSLTRTGAMMGTPAYMSPEQVQGQQVGPATDVYALGIVLFEMMTGLTPFRGDTTKVLHDQVYETAPAIRGFNPNLPKEMESILHKTLAKDPEQRYSSAGALATAVEGIDLRKETGKRQFTPIPKLAAVIAGSRAGTTPVPPPPVTATPIPQQVGTPAPSAGTTPIPSRRRVHWSWAVVGLAAVAVLAITVWLLIQSASTPPEPSGTPTSAGLSAVTAADTTTPTGRSAPPVATTRSPKPTVLAEDTSLTPKPSTTPEPPTATGANTATLTVTRTKTPTPTVTPTRTSTPTATRTRTPVPAATRTPTASPTGVPSPLPTPSRAATRTPRPKPSNTPAAAGTEYPAPELLAPANDQSFSAGDVIQLRWDSVGPLAADVYYEVLITFTHLGETWPDETERTKDTAWTVSSDHAYLLELAPDGHPMSDDGVFRWSVTVIQQTGTGVGAPVGPASKERTFIWQAGPVGSGTQPAPGPTRARPDPTHVKPGPTLPKP